MERLESKTIKGRTYYYYSKWARVDGKPRRLWQKYLGKLDDIARAVQAGTQQIGQSVAEEAGLAGAGEVEGQDRH